MQKFILFFILSLLFVAFGAFLFNSYVLQNNYFKTKTVAVENQTIPTELPKNPSSTYKNYVKEDYDKAVLENRVVFLFFTSNWCSNCLSQEEINKSLFNEMQIQAIVGLNIHILDSETTSETDALAKKFDITKENTYVILNKKGAVNFKYTGEITKELLIEKIMKAGESN